MSGKYKLNTTRPMFLLNMMGNDAARLDEDVMRRHMYDTQALSYCVYTALLEADIQQKDIEDVNNDGESIAIRFTSKHIAKEVKEKCKDMEVRYGDDIYHVSAKLRDKYLIMEACTK